jgi:hypothetical protein
MKYYIYRFNEKSGYTFKKTKCNDYWSNNFAICWQYSEQGAKKIVNAKNEARKNNLYQYGMVETDKVEQLIANYEKHLDKQTYISERMSERPYWI